MYAPIMMVAIVFAFLTSLAQGKPNFVNDMPNGNQKFGNLVLGHSSSSPGNRDIDAFGDDYDKFNGNWLPDLCAADSDGDGKTNGEELGDPECIWQRGDTPAITSGLTNPGDATDSDGSLFLGLVDFSNPLHIGGFAAALGVTLLIVRTGYNTVAGKRRVDASGGV